LGVFNEKNYRRYIVHIASLIDDEKLDLRVFVKSDSYTGDRSVIKKGELL